MAIQFTDFSGLPTQESFMTDLVPRIEERKKAMDDAKRRQIEQMIKQVELEYAPRKNEADLSKTLEDIAHRKLENQYYGPSQEQKLAIGNYDLKEAARNYANPGLKSNIPEVQLWAMEHLLGNESNSGQNFSDIANQLRSDQNTKKERERQIVASHEWNSMPEEARKHQIGKAWALGISPDEFIHDLLHNGKSLEQQAQERGFSPEKIASTRAKHLPTTATVTQGQRAARFNAERQILEEHMNAASNKYSRKFFGYSPKQVMEAIGGENKDEQARLLAARALFPEVAGIRFGALGGTMGIRAIQAMKESALMESKVFNSLVEPEVFQKMNEYIGQWLNEAYDAAQEAQFGMPGSPAQQSTNSLEESNYQGTGYSLKDIQETALAEHKTVEQIISEIKRLS